MTPKIRKTPKTEKDPKNEDNQKLNTTQKLKLPNNLIRSHKSRNYLNGTRKYIMNRSI